jgi:hypothetical protein
MQLSDIINSLEKTETQKTASVRSEKPASVPDDLLATLNKVASVDTSGQRYNQADPVDDLMKIATTMVQADEEHDLALSSICGQAFADSAIQKLAEYDTQARMEMSKLAEMYPAETSNLDYDTVVKLAEDTVISILDELGIFDKEGSYNGDEDDVYAPELVEETIKEASAAVNEIEEAVEKALEEEALEEEALEEALEEEALEEEALEEEAVKEEAVKEEAVKEASDILGALDYALDSELLEKEAYDQGADEELQEIYDIATAEFFKGAAEAEILVKEAGLLDA